MNRTYVVISLLLITLLLTACGRNRDEAVPAPAATVTEAPAAATPEAEATDAEGAEEGGTVPADSGEAAEDAGESPLVAADAGDSPLAVESPLDSPESPLATPVVVEPPSLDVELTDDTGALVGRILLNNESGVRPVTNMIVGLGEVLRDTDGTPLISGYDAAAAPKTATDDLGRFAIDELEEGTYTIILDAVITSILLADPVTGDPILIDIVPGEVMDLGRLDYESLALPGYTE